MTYQKGDKVRVTGRHGVLTIRGPFQGGRYVGEGFWVWSHNVGKVFPALTGTIRRVT